MATDNAERQYLIACEMDLLLAEGERTENHLFDLDYENDNDPEVKKEKAWLDHVRVRRNVLDEELHELQRTPGARRRCAARRPPQPVTIE